MTIVEKVNNQIADLKAKKEEELETIDQKRTELSQLLAEAIATQNKAAETMDYESFDEAKKLEAKYRTGLEMYQKRYEQIFKREYMTEEESDSVIDSLLAYEKELADRFEKESKPLLDSLKSLVDSYSSELDATAFTIRKWENEIFHNYRSFTGSSRLIDGKPSNRMNHAVFVHITPPRVCKTAALLMEVFKNGN